jgi:hypothetical protein
MDVGRMWMVVGVLAAGCLARPVVVPKLEREIAASAKDSGLRVAPCSQRRAPDLLVEDAEASDGAVVFVGGYGGWFGYKDEAGSVSAFGIAPGGFGSSKHAARLSGALATGQLIYAGAGISLGMEPFDASMYRGVRFRAKIAAPSTSKVRFTVADVHTDFGVELDLSEQWQEFALDFDSLKQAPGSGRVYPALVPNAVYSLGWAVTDQGQPFDVWIDDVRFIGCQ